MTSFSASDAALEGFQVIRTQWRVALGWCLFSIVGFVGLVIVAFFVILAAAFVVTSKEQAGTAGGLIGAVVLGLGGAAIQGLIVVALYRMRLRPGAAPGLYYLRVSRDEGRLLGLWIVMGVAFVALMMAGFPLLRALEPVGGLAVWTGTLAYLAFLVWLAIRFSLAGPANFATGRFGLADSWRLTRGRFWALLGMTVLALCLLLLIAVVLFILTAVVQAAIGGFHTLAPVSLADPQALAERPGAYAFALVAELVIAPLYLVIGQAPFAAAYKALSAEA
jgi:hypothetical protein